MLEFVEFNVVEVWDAEAHIDELSIFAQLSDGRVVHLRDYYYEEASFEFDEKGRLVYIYSRNVSLEIIDGRLFEITYDLNGCGHDSEVTMPMLLADVSYI